MQNGRHATVAMPKGEIPMQTDFLQEARKSFELAAQATQKHEMELYADIGRKCLTLMHTALDTEQPDEIGAPVLEAPKEFDFSRLDFSRMYERN
jgi:hypothetical protein